MYIAVDLDDVILDFGGGVRHAVETEYDVVIPPFEKWEMHEVLDPILGKSWWKWMRERDWLWSNFPAIPGAIGGLAQLRDAGHYLEIVTSKPEWAEFSVWKWLGKWRPPVNRVTIVNMDTRKVDVTDADALIDDKPANVNEFDADGRIGILFYASHNATSGEARDGVIKAKDWKSVVEIVNLEEAVR
jgi:5'(3')-deoxyribonucleotidase